MTSSPVRSSGRPIRILIFSQFYAPDVTAAAFRIRETAELLADRGFEVHVIAGAPHKAEVKGASHQDDPRLRVTRVPIVPVGAGGKWGYLRHYFSFMFGAIAAARKHPRRFDLVWASSPPLFTAVAGYVVSRSKRARLMLDIRDIWPESAAVAGQLRPESPLFRGAKVVERLLYRLADQISCVARPMADYIHGVCPKHHPVVVYNGIPAGYVDADDAPVEPRADGPIEIVYVGNMGLCQNLGLVVEAAALLQRAGDRRARFRFIGEGVERPRLEEQIRREGLDNVELSRVVPKAEALRIMRQAGALCLLLKDDGTMDKTIPSKVFDYLAAGVPVLFGLNGEGRTIFERTGGNLYFQPNSAADLVRAVTELAQTFAAKRQAARENRTLVRREFLREAMVDRLADSMRRLLRGGSGAFDAATR